MGVPHEEPRPDAIRTRKETHCILPEESVVLWCNADTLSNCLTMQWHRYVRRVAQGSRARIWALGMALGEAGEAWPQGPLIHFTLGTHCKAHTYGPGKAWFTPRQGASDAKTAPLLPLSSLSVLVRRSSHTCVRVVVAWSFVVHRANTQARSCPAPSETSNFACTRGPMGPDGAGESELRHPRV